MTKNKMIPVPIEAFKRYEEMILRPNTVAWMKIVQLIDAGLKDPEINCNANAVVFLQMMAGLSENAWGHHDVERVLKPLFEKIRSNIASNAAKKKNSAMRAWVCQQWEAQGRPSKSKFSQNILLKLKEQFPNAKLPGKRQIETEYLPKLNK